MYSLRILLSLGSKDLAVFVATYCRGLKWAVSETEQNVAKKILWQLTFVLKLVSGNEKNVLFSLPGSFPVSKLIFWVLLSVFPSISGSYMCLLVKCWNPHGSLTLEMLAFWTKFSSWISCLSRGRGDGDFYRKMFPLLPDSNALNFDWSSLGTQHLELLTRTWSSRAPFLKRGKFVVPAGVKQLYFFAAGKYNKTLNGLPQGRQWVFYPWPPRVLRKRNSLPPKGPVIECLLFSKAS